MIDVAILAENPWPASARVGNAPAQNSDGLPNDWDALATKAVLTALAATPFAALADSNLCIEVAIKLSDNAEVQMLNRDYRGKDKPTNILSFPQTPPDLLVAIASSVSGGAAGDDSEAILGDMILAYETCIAEAGGKAISLADHVTHLIVHGTLHLLGYDHIEEEEAVHMEALEIDILAGLGLADPYGDRD